MRQWITAFMRMYKKLNPNESSARYRQAIKYAAKHYRWLKERGDIK